MTRENMKYADRVYGQVDINEPVVLGIIKTPAFTRLKDVDQWGYPPMYANPKSLPTEEMGCKRYEHSLGVYVLLKLFKAPIKEQIAGLIHDISHTVFSHSIDYALKEGSGKKHNYQDDTMKTYIKTTNIPDILAKYNFDLDYILNKNYFPLLEKEAPDLCADRIDYLLRDALVTREINNKKVTALRNGLIAENNQWVFEDYKLAREFADLFYKMNFIYYCNLESAAMFRSVGDVLQYAIQNQYISMDDIYTTDTEILMAVNKYAKSDEYLKKMLNRMNNKKKFENNPDDYDNEVFCKSRMVDPLFKKDNKIMRISDVDKDWGRIVEQELKPKQYFLKFID